MGGGGSILTYSALSLLSCYTLLLQKHMENVDWRRQLVASRVSSAFSPYLFEGYGHGTVFPTRKDDLTECRRCPPNSRRGRGRGGLVYHCAELGTFYNLLTPVGDSQWTVSYVLNVAVVVGGRKSNSTTPPHPTLIKPSQTPP